MDRRTFFAGGLLALAIPAAADAPRRARHLVVLRDSPASPDMQRAFVEWFRQDGWDAGRDLTIEFVNLGALKDPQTIERRIQELAATQPTAFLVETDLYVPIVKRTAGDVPIVISNICCDDYVARLGWVQSIARPGGNITGTLQPAIYDKSYQIARQLRPKLKRIGILYPDSVPTLLGPLLKMMQDDARAAGRKLKLDIVEIVYPEGAPFAAVEQQVRKAKVDAIDAWLGTQDEAASKLMGLFERAGILGLWPDASFVRAGGLMAVAADLRLGTTEAIKIAGRVLRGVKPSEIPLQVIRTSHLSLNLATARRMKIHVPDSVRKTAEVVVS